MIDEKPTEAIVTDAPMTTDLPTTPPEAQGHPTTATAWAREAALVGMAPRHQDQGEEACILTVWVPEVGLVEAVMEEGGGRSK